MSAARSFTPVQAANYGHGVVPEARVWRYVLPTNQQSDGGTFLLDASGMFSGTSAYGGFAYRWGGFGDGDFRAFFEGLDASYLYGKLHHRPRTMRLSIDRDATVRAIRKRLWEDYGSRGDTEAFRQELEHLDAVGDIDEEGGLDRWLSGTALVEPWFIASTNMEDPECWALCTKLLPRLQARLRLDVKKGRA